MSTYITLVLEVTDADDDISFGADDEFKGCPVYTVQAGNAVDDLSAIREATRMALDEPRAFLNRYPDKVRKQVKRDIFARVQTEEFWEKVVTEDGEQGKEYAHKVYGILNWLLEQKEKP
jgi:hypothetical protein